MAVKNPYAKLLQDKIYTASKEELTLMLYDGALKFANQAIIAIENKDVPKAHESIVKVQNIIKEFQLTLDHKYEISSNFNLLYDYIFRLLVDANLHKDKKPLEEARDLIRDFRDMWKEAMKLSKQVS